MSAPKGYVCRNSFNLASTQMLRILLKTTQSEYVRTEARAELERRGVKT
jgi:hypothetical protein